ncbi:WXG100 family type VII secretion target [Nocardia sp. NPDC046473]|uniref:WXG100 family type VII secretion target n=1 Tax=Nocardia sp. NPDC046473 TaxID=3155733 RepID=UPI0033F8BDCC
MTARRYDLDAMQAFIDVLDKAIAAVGDHSTKTKNIADGVLAQFSGTTAQAFSDSQREWLSGTTTLVDELRAIREKIALAHSNYLQAEQANKEMRS